MARLILEDGSEYRGQPFGALKSTTGEIGLILDKFLATCKSLTFTLQYSRLEWWATRSR